MLASVGKTILIAPALLLLASAASVAGDKNKLVQGIPLPPTPVSKNNIKLLLFTRQKKGIEISDTNLEGVDAEKEIKVISHGWNEDKSTWYYPKLTEQLLKKGDYNVIQVDWPFYSRQVYAKAAANTRGVGYYVGTVIAKIHKEKNIPLEKIHFIGHSLGSHVVGFAGKKVKELTGDKIRLISALDPAGPEFEIPLRDKNSRLSNTDANIVEAVHTNIGANGFTKPIGTIDFYVNGGGPLQPGCPDTALCSHQKSVGYYLDGLEKNGLTATECESQVKFEAGGCKGNKKAILGVESAKSEPKGVFYLNAVTKYPIP